MFTIFHARKNRIPLYEKEKSYLFMRFSAHMEKNPEAMWLLAVNYRNVEWFWSPGMNAENGVMGCADPIRNAVYLMREPNVDIIEELHKGEKFDTFWLSNLFPIAVHELRHVWQYKRSPVIYTLLSLPGIREISLEADAWAHTPGGRQ